MPGYEPAAVTLQDFFQRLAYSELANLSAFSENGQFKSAKYNQVIVWVNECLRIMELKIPLNETFEIVTLNPDNITTVPFPENYLLLMQVLSHPENPGYVDSPGNPDLVRNPPTAQSFNFYYTATASEIYVYSRGGTVNIPERYYRAGVRRMILRYRLSVPKLNTLIDFSFLRNFIEALGLSEDLMDDIGEFVDDLEDAPEDTDFLGEDFIDAFTTFLGGLDGLLAAALTAITELLFGSSLTGQEIGLPDDYGIIDCLTTYVGYKAYNSMNSPDTLIVADRYRIAFEQKLNDMVMALPHTNELFDTQKLDARGFV